MKYIAIGTVSSEIEFRTVIENAEGDQIDQLVELLKLIEKAERESIDAERKRRWIDVPHQNAVKVYAGVGENSASEDAIWAAIEVGKDGKTVTLLKIVDTFSGDKRQSEELLADALHRRDRGTRL